MIGTANLNQTYSTSTDVKYGDIFLIDFDGAKFSEQCGKRPAIVVSNDKGNQHSPTMLVVPLTTKNKKKLPTHLTIEPEKSGLKEISTALFEQVKVADKKRIIKKMGHVDNSLIEKNKKRVDNCIWNMLECNCQKQIFKKISKGGIKMVLYLDEFSKEEYFCGKILRYYDSLPKYLHEMSVDEIMKRITRNGKRTVYFQKMAMEKYFSWLHQKYGIDVAKKNYELQKSIKYDSNVYVGFYDLKDLKESIESALQTIDSLEGDMPDYSGLIAIFYLEWYGVLPLSAITIKLTDVSNDGKKIFVPAENRTVEISDDGVACYFAEYKHKTGWNRYKGKITPYTQDTFYRNTSRRGDTINEKTIYNIRRHFVTDSGDTRFAKKRIYYAGIYFKLFQFEQNYSKEPLSNKYVTDKLRELCNNPELSENSIGVLMREYKIYRRNYLEKI